MTETRHTAKPEVDFDVVIVGGGSPIQPTITGSSIARNASTKTSGHENRDFLCSELAWFTSLDASLFGKRRGA